MSQTTNLQIQNLTIKHVICGNLTMWQLRICSGLRKLQLQALFDYV